jgi:acyl carrier protein
LGLLFAEYLARTTRARLVLLGRTALPTHDRWEHWLLAHDGQDDTSRKIRSVQALEAQGAEVLVCGADVTDQEQMRTAVSAAKQRFGAVHGVIHAAGLAGGGIIQFKTPEIADTVLAPKVKGTLVLYDLFKEVQLDFFVLCSSINAIVGGFGQVDYCAANAFLDTFAAHIRFGSNPFVTSVNWDRWQGVGMALNTDEQVIGLGSLLNGMAPQEGIEVFSRILETSPLSQIIISSKHLPSLMDYARLFMTAYAENMAQIGSRPGTYTRPNLKTAYVAPTTDLERAITDIWQKVLGIEQIGIYDSFLDLGGNSLVAIQLTAQLRATFGLDLSLNELFEASTVAGLAQLVADAQVELDEQETLEILRRLEQLSEAEIEQEIKGKLYSQGRPLDP